MAPCRLVRSITLSPLRAQAFPRARCCPFFLMCFALLVHPLSLRLLVITAAFDLNLYPHRIHNHFPLAYACLGPLSTLRGAAYTPAAPHTTPVATLGTPPRTLRAPVQTATAARCTHTRSSVSLLLWYELDGGSALASARSVGKVDRRLCARWLCPCILRASSCRAGAAAAAAAAPCS